MPISLIAGIFQLLNSIWKNIDANAPKRKAKLQSKIATANLGYKPPIQFVKAPPTPTYSRLGMWDR